MGYVSNFGESIRLERNFTPPPKIEK